MTLRANARWAGFLFLFYIVVGLGTLLLSGSAIGGGTPAERMANIAHHATTVRVCILGALLQFFIAVSLGVALYALTRDVDRELALVALCCRVTEGVVGAFAPLRTLALLWVSAEVTRGHPETAGLQALGGLLLAAGPWPGLLGGSCFAVGSTLFSLLFLRARSIPVPLAWLGVVSSVALVVVLPLQLAGLVGGPLTSYVWIPMLAFEVPLGVWLLVKGVSTPAGDRRPLSMA